MMAPRSAQYRFSLKTVSWKQSTLQSLQKRYGAELPFDVLLHGADEPAAQIPGQSFRPGARRQGADGPLQHFVGDDGGLRADGHLGQDSGQPHGPQAVI